MPSQWCLTKGQKEKEKRKTRVKKKKKKRGFKATFEMTLIAWMWILLHLKGKVMSDGS